MDCGGKRKRDTALRERSDAAGIARPRKTNHTRDVFPEGGVALTLPAAIQDARLLPSAATDYFLASGVTFNSMRFPSRSTIIFTG